MPSRRDFLAGSMQMMGGLAMAASTRAEQSSDAARRAEHIVKAHEETVRAYGKGDEASRAAYTVLKRTFEKCGDHWIAKAESAA